MRLSEHSHNTTQSAASRSGGRNKRRSKQKGRRRSNDEYDEGTTKERHKAKRHSNSRSSSLGRSGHSKNSEGTSKRLRRHDINDQRRSRRERGRQPALGAGTSRPKASHSRNNSFSDLRDLERIIDRTSQLSLTSGFYRRRSSSPPLEDLSNEGFVSELQHRPRRLNSRPSSSGSLGLSGHSKNSDGRRRRERRQPSRQAPRSRSNSFSDLSIDNYDNEEFVPELQHRRLDGWTGDLGLQPPYFSRPGSSIISPMEYEDERVVALKHHNEDLKIRIGMLELQQQNDALKTRIERMEDGDAGVPSRKNPKANRKKQQRSTSSRGSDDSSEWNSFAEEDDYVYEKRKNPKANRKKQ
mmetsp:Transcript_32069/g.77913  ORF Transcript_32069/g.77913 Transcript_32069/m.77913 type:complete len:354 (+) Transcript_32069:77-1138(+)